MSVIFRPATVTDADAIIQFQILMARETEGLELDTETCARGVHAVFQEPLLGQYHVAEKDGAVIASTLITYEWSDWRDGIVWWMQSVYVAPDARRRGIFRRFYEYLKNIAEGNERVRGIRLYVDKRNKAAQEVYARLGMDGEHYQVFEWMKKNKDARMRDEG